MEDYFHFLKTIYFFEALSDTDIRKIGAVCREEHFPEGAVIVREDTPGDRFFFILEGEVDVRKDFYGPDPDLLAVLKPRQSFGELALIDSSPRSASVTARSSCRLLSVRRDDFERVIAGSAAISLCVMRSISAMVRSQNELFVERLRREKRELKKVCTDLRNEIAERRLLEERLRQARTMEAVGRLAGGVAHDFNNIFQVIQGNVSLMLLDMPPATPGHQRLRSIEKSVESAALLTQKLLGFAGSNCCNTSTVILNDILGISTMAYKRRNGKVCVCETYEPDLWPVSVNPGEIMQAFSDIFCNAWEAMPDGGTLMLQTENRVLEDRDAGDLSLPQGRYVVIRIEDTGAGMDAATLRRIFEPFFTTKPGGLGRGLSLASVYNIIKCHSGAIQAESEKGTGTVVTIYLPAAF